MIYQRAPLHGQSLYSRNIVGESALRANEPAVYRTIETSLNSVDLLGKTQEGQWMKQKVYPIHHNKKNIAALVLEKRLDGTNLREKMNMKNPALPIRLDDFVLNKIDIAVLYFNKEGFLYKINRSGEKLYRRFGYLEKLIHLHYDNLSVDFSTFEQMMAFKNSVRQTNALKRRVFFGNAYFEVKYEFTKPKANDGFIMFIKDITEIQLKDEEIVHKSVAIKEIHHRVKNNLQTIISLLRIQARKNENESVNKILNESIQRVMAIAKTHELLSHQYQDYVRLQEVLTVVINNHSRSCAVSSRITVKKEIDSNLYFNSEKIISISLIVNELIQNCFKHAFKNQDKGTISVSVKPCNQGKNVEIFVQDNGRGFKNTDKKTGFGIQIVKSYTEDKLKGNLKIDSDQNGTKIWIKFKP